MYPSQTSLIPVTIALTRYLSENGISAFTSVYPYWYAGSTPFRYLIGPIAPLILLFIKSLLPQSSFWDISIYILLISHILSALGWGIIIRKLSGSKKLFFLYFLLLLLLPWRLFFALVFNEISVSLAKYFLPFALLAYSYYLHRQTLYRFVLAVIAVSALILTNTSILPLLVIGFISLLIARPKLAPNIYKHTLLIFILALSASSYYYSPQYFITVITNPSLGGAPAYKVFLRLLDILRYGLPLSIAYFIVRQSKSKAPSRFFKFSLIWTLTFLFLTLYRFLADPDFWQDWTAWFSELEIGLALILPPFLKSRRFAYILPLLIPFILTNIVYSLLGRPALLSKSPPPVTSSLKALENISKGKSIYLSGSNVFWANALYDLRQLRGGRDSVALDPSWAQASYELREGESAEKSKAWLSRYQISYALVHTESSRDYYHDFKSISKWYKLGEPVWEQNGDLIFKINLD